MPRVYNLPRFGLAFRAVRSGAFEELRLPGKALRWPIHLVWRKRVEGRPRWALVRAALEKGLAIEGA